MKAYNIFGLFALMGGFSLLSSPYAAASGGGTSYPDIILNDAPVAYYRLDEQSGAIQDSSGRNNPGTLLGDGLQRNVSGLIWADTDTAVRFNYQGYGSVPNKNYLNFAGQPFTLETWIQAQVYPDGRILDKSKFGTTQGYELGVSNGTLYFGGSTQLFVSFPWVTNRIYHIVAEADGNGSGTIFVNGRRVVSGPVVDSWDYAGNLLLGADMNGTQRFNGTMDEVAVYNKTLTEEQVKKHYSAGAVPAPGALWVAVLGLMPGVVVLSRRRRLRYARRLRSNAP